MSIAVENICKNFGTQKALLDVSFMINSGEITALIGPNGAGKSTLMRIITGLVRPSSGKVRVNNMDVASSAEKIRYHLGYLPENNPLYNDLYVREYLEHIAGLYKLGRAKKARVDEIVKITGLTPEQHKKIGQLSKGFKQRVGIAQAIVHNPDVMILDEPTTGLDPNQIIEIRSLISALGSSKTVILSTHIMQEVEAICHRVIILNRGQIVAHDSAAQLSSQGIANLQTYLVEFNLEVSENFFAPLKEITTLRRISSGKWLIESSDSVDLRASLFNMAVQNHLIILSLHKQDRRLEEIFRELTS
jgi:ABC-2 type transport system ATP-binding protein